MTSKVIIGIAIAIGVVIVVIIIAYNIIGETIRKLIHDIFAGKTNTQTSK